MTDKNPRLAGKTPPLAPRIIANTSAISPPGAGLSDLPRYRQSPPSPSRANKKPVTTDGFFLHGPFRAWRRLQLAGLSGPELPRTRPAGLPARCGGPHRESHENGQTRPHRSRVE